MNKGLIENKK